MTYKAYKRFQTFFFFLFIPVLILNQIGDKFSLLSQNRFLNEAIFYAIPVLSLAILYLGIYAYKNKIKTKKKMDGPVPLIIIGLILSIISFGRPVVGILLLSDANYESISAFDYNSIKEEALSLDNTVDERIIAAKYYYLHTGYVIEYYDDNEKKVFYSPNDSDRVERKDHIKMMNGIEEVRKHLESVIIHLFSIATISCLCFLLLLKYTKK